MRMSLETLGGDRYVLGDVLGHGGTAVVVRAHDRTLERDVAIKILAENLAADPTLRTRFLREARMAARWSHPNLVQVFDVGEEDERPFMVMEYIEGPNLAVDLAGRGPFSADEVTHIGISVCAALSHMHASGLVHRDVKPANLLRASDGTVKMTDFGIALDPAMTALTAVGAIVGTVAYLAPERVAGTSGGPTEDIYSLGVCLYEMLTGRTPYEAATLPDLVRKHRHEPPSPIREVNPSVPEALAATVTRCLARDPTHRPPSADALAAELRGVEATTRVAAATPPVGPIPTGAPPATRILRLNDEQTVMLRAPEPEAPGPMTEWLAPAPMRRGLGRLLAAAVGVLVVIGVLVIAMASGASDQPAPPQVRAPGQTTQPADGGTEPAAEARELAEWIRAHTR